jgi:hypothetical protein
MPALPFMSDTEPREQRSRTPISDPPAHRPFARSERESSEPLVSAREQARLADLQRCIDSMRKVAGDLEARVVDLECSVGRIGSAFGQMAGLHDMVIGGVSRGRNGGGYVERPPGARRDFYNRQDPPRGEHVPPPFGNGGNFNGRGRGRRP